MNVIKENYFLERRSCRFFQQKKVSEEIINDIIRKAMKAPTCGNMQLYSIIITNETETLKRLSEFHYNQPAASTAPIILTICADFNRFTRWCDLKNADAGFNNFHSFVTAMTDAIILSQQIVTIAELEGFGTCYLGTVTYNAEQISSLLKLPELVVPVASLAIGYIEKEGDMTQRLSLNAIVHKEFYDSPSDQEILEFYSREEEDPENKKFVVENKKENLAQVFSEVRYPRSMNEKISKEFDSLLRKKGFLE